MPPSRIPCLILACGNTLRGDDGLGPDLAAWAEERFQENSGVQVLSQRLWTPELVEQIANSATVLFLDSSVNSPAGAVQLLPVGPAERTAGIDTHHVEPAQLLSLCEELYDRLPDRACLLTVGIASTDLGAGFSEAVQRALPEACTLLETTVRLFLASAQRS